MRKLKAEDLVGKTIAGADCGSVNMTKLTFEDGTELEIWYELGVASIPGAFVEGEEENLQLVGD